MLPSTEAKSSGLQPRRIQEGNSHHEHQITIDSDISDQNEPFTLLQIYCGPIRPSNLTLASPTANINPHLKDPKPSFSLPRPNPIQLKILLAGESGEQLLTSTGSSIRSLRAIAGAFLVLCLIMLLFKLFVMGMSEDS